MNNKFIISGIISGISLIIPLILGLVLPFTKSKIKNKSYIYLYSLSSGFILVLGLFGLIAQPIMHFMEESNINKTNKVLTSIGIAVGGSIIGMGTAFFIRHLMHNEKDEIHQDHSNHKHDDYIFNLKELGDGKRKLTAIILITLHKLPAGIALGIFASSIHGHHNLEWAAIAAIIIHMIPEILTVYYRQIEYGISKWKALLISFAIQTILIPCIFIGTIIGGDSSSWFRPFILTIAGSILVFAAIVELIPEFIDYEFTHNKWHKTILMFIIGFISALTILIVHTH